MPDPPSCMPFSLSGFYRTACPGLCILRQHAVLDTVHPAVCLTACPQISAVTVIRSENTSDVNASLRINPKLIRCENWTDTRRYPVTIGGVVVLRLHPRIWACMLVSRRAWQAGEHAMLPTRDACGGVVHGDLSVHIPEGEGGFLCSRAGR